jgi:type IV pilus assembly protein PilY1
MEVIHMRTKHKTIFCILALLLFALAIPQYVQASTFEVRVASGYDDAEERYGGSWDGRMDVGDYDLELTEDYSYNQIVGIRFRNIQIPQGYTITNAYIEFSADETGSTSTNLSIYGEDIDDAPIFRSGWGNWHNISNRTKTSASVSWSPEAWTTVHATYRTTDISSIVQEIVNRSGWAAGNAMVFIIEGSGKRVAESCNGAGWHSSQIPLLHVEFTAANTHTISASAGSGGSISPSGPITVVEGSSQSFTITPDAGNSISDVVVDGSSLGTTPSSYTFSNVTADHTIVASFTLPPGECRDISDIPLNTLVTAAPANIMFVLDDSGSMDWEFITTENDGLFEGEYYVFDDPGDNLYGSYYDDKILGGTDRLKWKSQWTEYNKMYYDSTTTYDPWPSLTDADPDTPRSHPVHSSPTFDLNGTYTSIELGYIIDDLDTDMFSNTGIWGDSTSSEAYDSHYYFTNQDNQDITATWIPNLPAGEYDVYAKWYHNSYRSTVVPYTITYAGGATATVTVNQRLDDGGWYHLGTYNFDEGAGSVSITYHVGDNTQTRVCADAVKFVSTAVSQLDIIRAHYYAWSSEEGKPYLINLDGDIKYYSFNDADGDDIVDAGELWPITSPPSDVQLSRTYAEERQNFANWYQFYRRRELTAAASIAKVIASMQGVQIGFRTINGNLKQPVLKVKVEGDDESGVLLNNLYSLVLSAQGTPLRRGLEYVGQYFDQDDGVNPSGLGSSPYASAAQGGECQQAFAVVMTDGYWNGSSPGVGNEDGDNNTDFDGSPYADGYSSTLADVAMEYYENDLSSGLNDLVPTTDTDTATHQHLVTYGVSFGVYGTLNPDDYDIENDVFPEWPKAVADSNTAIDDLYHASVNGRGTFLSASKPDDLVNSLLSIMQHIESRIASASAVSVNGDELYEELGENILMFQASYNSDGWTGDVKAYGIDTGTGQVITTSYQWSAADELETTNWDTGRIIATYDGSSGIPFRYGSLSTTQQGQLDADPTTAENILNYLRGDDSNEEANGGPFRDRYWRLGDLVHSSPVFNSDVLYTGGNDGMLHAFSANNGAELFAYVPNLVFENLSRLADTEYSHQYYVDLTPTVEEIPSLNQTVLVGGLGKGGKGYYALDVTNAASIDTETTLASRFLWEYGNDDDLGYTFSKPVIVDSYDSSVGYVVIFGNGYSSVNESAVLYVLNPITGQLIKKIDTGVGSCNGLSSPVAIDVNMDQKVDYVYAGDLKGNMWKFDFTGSTYSDWDIAYEDGSGDPQPVFQATGPGGAIQPITVKPDVMRHCEKDGYIVVFATGSYLGETDVSDTSTHTIYGIWDYGDDDDDSEYLGTFDRGATSPDTELSNQPETVTMLQQVEVAYGVYNGETLRTLSDNEADWETEEDPDSTEGDPRWDNPSSTVDNHAGWYFDLPASGERVVVDVMIRDEKAVVVSFYPEVAPCGSGGYSMVHEIDACTGARLTDPQFDINDDGVIDDSDMINIGTEENPIMVPPSGVEREGRLQPPAILRMDQTEMKYFSSSSGSIATVMEQVVRLGITSWREYSQ